MVKTSAVVAGLLERLSLLLHVTIALEGREGLTRSMSQMPEIHKPSKYTFPRDIPQMVFQVVGDYFQNRAILDLFCSVNLFWWFSLVGGWGDFQNFFEELSAMYKLRHESVVYADILFQWQVWWFARTQMCSSVPPPTAAVCLLPRISKKPWMTVSLKSSSYKGRSSRDSYQVWKLKVVSFSCVNLEKYCDLHYTPD